MQVSMFPSNPRYPMAPPYKPRLTVSSSSMICMARILGAPESVPAGSAENRASTAVLSFRSRPRTSLTRCITLEARSTCIKSRTSTVPNLQTRPTSFRPRSTSMVCSARSFPSRRRFRSSLLSSASSFPRGAVPAIGLLVTAPPSTRMSISGEAPAIR